jgi:type II secretory pathway pseudopilin PulG
MGGAMGFTLVESMAVLFIVIALAAISMPAIRTGISHHKLANALDTFVNQVEFARSQAAARNRAYRLLVVLGSGDTRGSITLTEGFSSLCTPDNFATDGAGAGDAIQDVRSIDFATDHPNVLIRDLLPSSIETEGICLKPDGRVLEINTLGGTVLPAEPGYAAGEAMYELELLNGNGQATGLVQKVIVPYNGIPRVEVP